MTSVSYSGGAAKKGTFFKPLKKGSKAVIPRGDYFSAAGGLFSVESIQLEAEAAAGNELQQQHAKAATAREEEAAAVAAGTQQQAAATAVPPLPYKRHFPQSIIALH